MNGTSLLALAMFFAVVFAIALRPRRETSHGALNLLRALLPSWRFFEDFGPVPRLLVRTRTDEEDFGSWAPVLMRPTRRLTSLWINAEANLFLAQQSLVERLASEVGEYLDESGPQVAASVSYQLVDRLVRARLRDWSRGERVAYQFKLCIEEFGEPPGEQQDLVISPESEL